MATRSTSDSTDVTPLYLPNVTQIIGCLESFDEALVNGVFKTDAVMDAELKAKQDTIDLLISEAEKTSVCFMIDCTGSMSPWINVVKNNIKLWSEQLLARHTKMELNVAFVRYTDYDQPERTRTTLLDFTTNLDKFHRFVDKITTPSKVGGDQAEDVFGGIDAVHKLSWPKSGTKVMIHITDAPCHGTQYHTLSICDDYPDGDPKGLQLDHLMMKFAENAITYYFGYINKACTLPMIKAFNMSLQGVSNGIHSIQEFDAQDPQQLLTGAFRSVTTSIRATLHTLMNGGTRALRQYTVDENIPKWNSSSCLASKMVLVTPPPTTGSAAAITAPNNVMKVKIAHQPFAEGGQKIVYHAFDEQNGDHLVLKQSKWTDKRSNCIKRCIETAQIHAVAARFSAEFNRERPDDAYEIQFSKVGVMQVGDGNEHQFFTYEKFLQGSKYTKFNTNFYCLPEQDIEGDNIPSATCQAFSHYTWEKSGRNLVVCDLQGIITRSKLKLTDPVIHYTNILCHGSTNLGQRGIEQFFMIHKCNTFCRQLKLKHPNDLPNLD